jgi:hypothetical protein
MTCSRCRADETTGPRGWCEDCEREYDAWIRGYAGDIIPPVLAGMGIITVVATVLPFLGVGSLVAYGGVFAGFATLFGLFRLRRRARRRQFLTASLPRAYLPAKT